MGQSRPINSEWKIGCITKSTETEEPTCFEIARMESRTGALKLSVFTRQKTCWGNEIQGEKKIITTSTLAKWMVKVGTTSKSDVTQKEKKP